MNKVLKGLVAVAATAAMAVAGFAGASTATAAESDVTITVKNASVGDVYAGYRLFNETETSAEGDAKAVAYQKRGDWNHYDTVAAAIKSVDETATVTKDSKVEDFVDAINKLGSTSIKKFGETLYKSLKSAGISADVTSNAVAEGSDSVVLSGPQGYYLIAQTVANGDTGKTMSAVIVNTAGQSNTDVTTKKDTVSVSKQVQENQDGVNNPSADNWGTAADYNIGDDVPFREIGTLPADYADYGTYAYTFHDIQSNGLTFKSSTVEVFAKKGDSLVKIAPSSYSVLTGDDVQDGHTFDVKFANLKQAVADGDGVLNIDASTEIVVAYKSTLNDKAVLGEKGNSNEVYLEFSNNKYGEGTGKTENHKVTVFTFKLTVSKYANEVASGKELKGAGFTLYKATESNAAENAYRQVGTEVVNNSGNTFDFTGLDSGYYMLKETTTPKGYNTIDPIKFTVTATYNSTDEPGTLTDLQVNGSGQTFVANKATGDAGQAQITTNVVDKSGSYLPSTGGMGTVMLYVAGIAVFVIAGATLVLALRRRNA